MKYKMSLMAIMGLSMVMCMAGCGETNPGNSSAYSGGSQISSSADEGDIVRNSEGNVVYKNVSLNMWSVTTGDDAAVQDDIISQFNSAYSGMINVSVTHISRYDLETLLNNTMEFDKKNAPDILFNHGSRTAEYNERGWLLPVDDIFATAGVPYDKDDFVDSLLNTVTIDGVAYGMPIDCHSAMIEMRTDILEKNGYKIPTNYQELVNICTDAAKKAADNELWIRGENSTGVSNTEWRKASTADPYYAFPIAYGDMWVHEFLGYTAIEQNGGAIVRSDGMPAWNSAESIKGLQLLRDWIFPSNTSANSTAMSKDYGSSYDVGISPFRSGDALFTLEGPWTYESDRVGFDKVLRSDGGRNNITTRSLSNMLTLNTSSKNSAKIKGEGHAVMFSSTMTSKTKQCAAAVLSDFIAYNSGVEWAKSGHLPAVKSVYNSSAFTSDEAYTDYIQYWGNPTDYVVVPPTKYYSYVDTYFKNALQKTLASSFQSRTVESIVNSEYEDCLGYIQLYS